MSKLSQWKNREKSEEIPKLSSNDIKLASAGQQRLFSLQQLHPQSNFYQYGHLYKFETAVSNQELERRFTKVIEGHPILRSNFYYDGKQIVAEIKEDFKFELTHGEESVEDFFSLPFDLENDLLIRAKLLNERTLALSIHHIIADRQSLMIFNRALFENAAPSDHHIDYYDFAQWYLNKIDGVKEVKYWERTLNGELPVLDLPHDYSRPAIPSYKGDTIDIFLSDEVSSKLHLIARDLGITMYSLLLAGYSVLLYKYSRQKDILVGTPVTNRDRIEVQEMIGFFNETIVLRNSIDQKSSFEDFAKRVYTNFLEGLEYKDISFSKLVATLNPPRTPGINPLFQTMFLYNRHNEQFYYDGQSVKEEIVDLGVSKFDLTLFGIETEESISLKLEYSTDLFKKQTASRMLSALEQILTEVGDQPQTCLQDLLKLNHEELSRSHIVPKPVTNDSILELIDFSSKKGAVSFEGKSISYVELNEKADKFARELIFKGLEKNQIVGLYTPRSIEMIVGIIAILKAGGAYLPLDPTYPKERISYMMANAECKFMLSTEKIEFEGVANIDLESEPTIAYEVELPSISSNDLAYIIFTSGSSGQPKGVPITHKNLLYSTSARFDFYPENPEVFLLMSSFSFDSSVAGIFGPLK